MSCHFSCRHQVTKSNTSPEELGPLANQLTSDYGRLASEAKPAAVAAESEEVSAEAVATLPRHSQEMPSRQPQAVPSCRSYSLPEGGEHPSGLLR